LAFPAPIAAARTILAFSFAEETDFLRKRQEANIGKAHKSKSLLVALEKVILRHALDNVFPD
jgi:hypothetical protein